MPILSILFDSFDLEYGTDNHNINDEDLIVMNEIEKITGVHCKRPLTVGYVLLSQNTDPWGRKRNIELIECSGVCLSRSLFELYKKSKRIVIESKKKTLHVRSFKDDITHNCEIKPLTIAQLTLYKTMTNINDKINFLNDIQSIKLK